MSYIIRPYRKGKPLSTLILLESQYTRADAERVAWKLNAQPDITAHLGLPTEGARMPCEARERSFEGPESTREEIV